MEAVATAKKSWTWKDLALCLLGAFIVYCGVRFYKIISTPQSYEDCIMKTLSPGDSDTAAKLKAAACQKMYPRKYTDDQIFGKSK